MDRSLSEAELHEAMETCASEPVHIPGITQSFACLIGITADTEVISYASENCDEILSQKATALLGRKLGDVMTPEISHQLRNLAARPDFAGCRLPMGTFDIAGTLLELAGFRSGAFHVIEMEPVSNRQFGVSEALKSMGFLFSQIQSCETEQDLFDLTVDLVQHLTGFDRTLIYKFDLEFNGEVVAETRRMSMEPFIGLRFPSWDIPRQARDLMARTPLRLIDDVDGKTHPVLALGPDLPALDMTLAACRGVSPVHMEYLRNLGSQSTMTFNVSVEGRLWGMISMHHRTPRVLPPKLRELLETFLPIFASKLLSLRQKDTLERIGTLDRAITANAADAQVDRMLPGIAPKVLEAIGAEGMISVEDGSISVYGRVPGEPMIRAMVDHARRQNEDTVAIDSLAQVVPEQIAFANGCAGALMASLPNGNTICICRAEIAQEVSWAGNPEKKIEETDGRKRLSTRGSFSAYLEHVRGKSRAWTADDIYFFGHIRTLLYAAERQTLLNRMNRQQALMIDELNHRVRNILSLVKSVSRQSLRRHGALESFAEEIENRINALAVSHELTSGSLLHPVSVISLIQREFEPYGGAGGDRITLTGTDRNLRAEIAPIFSLVIHELATNAVKYGALTTATGTIDVRLDDLDGGLRLIWKETGGPEVTRPNDTGFGTAMIQQAIPHELGGTADLAFEADGVRAVLTLPARHLDSLSRPRTYKPEPPGPQHAPSPFSSAKLAASVLVLENNYIIAKELRDQLTDLGVINVEVFSSASAALEFLEMEEVSLAILDVNLGETGNSGQVAGKLKAMGVPFVFVSGYGDTNALVSAFPDAPLLTKPISALELEKQLAAIFN